MAYFSAKQSIKSPPPPPPPPTHVSGFFPFLYFIFFFPFKTFLRSVCPFHFWCSAYYLNALFNQTFSSIMAIFFIFMFFIDAHPPGCDRPVVCVCEGPSGCEQPNTPVHGVFDEKDNQNHVLRKKPLPTARSYSQCGGGGEGRFASERYKHRIFILSFDYEFLISRCLVISIYWSISPFFFFLGDLYNKYIYFPV